MPRKTRVTKRRGDGKTVVDGYDRVSTDDQAKEGVSMQNQSEKIRGYCALYDLELRQIVSDPGESAKSLNRPGIQRVLEDLKKGTIDGIVIYKLDRLTRNLGDWAWLINTFFNKRTGRELFSVTESVDTRTANGQFFLNIMVMVAEWERLIIAERTADALQGKIGRGERCGRIRYGYKLAADGVHLVPVPEEQEALRRMREWRAQGHTYQELVELLEKMGIETKEGGRLWLPATVHRILNRPIA